MADIRNIAIDQSANVLIEINVSNTIGGVLDLTNYTSNGCIKRHYESANVAIFTTDQFANGLFTLSLTGDESANLAIDRHVYEATITHTGTNTTVRVQEGILMVKPSIC